MSKKDYEKIAAMIYNLRLNIPFLEDKYYDDGYDDAVCDIAYGLAHIFANDNERFETQRFIRACGV